MKLQKVDLQMTELDVLKGKFVMQTWNYDNENGPTYYQETDLSSDNTSPLKELKNQVGPRDQMLSSPSPYSGNLW
ncbi:hypothetical protein TNIN_442331 [Trichonephila inaurata madagascariensis]|uniref:Uncharacterized protein n=1 Tax=Trichonephila inaurata madagascariensis TaxID=2747483 RepID=A0A8X6X9C9_9ARAC|nr:hypothetical protein TNIN_442331 [Trichonephila inaurata madagascariensis]